MRYRRNNKMPIENSEMGEREIARTACFSGLSIYFYNTQKPSADLLPLLTKNFLYNPKKAY
jgi:hypothetical protein